METFNENMYKVEKIVEIKDEQGNITNTYPVMTIDDSMLIDRKYAYVYLSEGQIYIQNFF